MSRISVSPATEAEAPAALALIAREFEPGLELLVARREGVVAGAAGVSWRHPRKLAGFGLTVGVRPSQRRHGVGRALAAAAAEMTAGEAPGLWSQLPLEDGSSAAAFAAACGFEARLREHHFSADRQGVAVVAPLLEGFMARQRLPEGARAIPLREASLEDAAWLLSAEFGEGPGAALARLRREDQAGVIDLDQSTAIMAGDELVAFSLASLRDELLTVQVVVVAPQWRGGWVNMLLMHDLLTRRDVARTLRFQCTEEAHFTLKMARRIEAVRERVTAYYFRPVG